MYGNHSEKNTIHGIVSGDSTVVTKGKKVADKVVPYKPKKGYVNGKPVDASNLVDTKGNPVKLYTKPPAPVKSSPRFKG